MISSKAVIVKGASCIGSSIFDLNEIETLGYPIACAEHALSPSSDRGRQKRVTFASSVMEHRYLSHSKKINRCNTSQKVNSSGVQEDPIIKKILQEIDDDEARHSELSFSQINRNENQVLRQNLAKIRTMLDKAQENKKAIKKNSKNKQTRS